MKPILALTFFLVSCAPLTPEQKATLEVNAFKDANAALVGGLSTGSWVGAAAGAGAQVIRNHTAAKQPIGKVQP